MKLVIIKTELDLAITYSKIAQESDNEENIAKHRASARKAYDSAIHFLASGALAPDEEMEITKRLAALKVDLEELGENF